MGIEFGSIFIVKYVVDNQKSFKKVTQLPLVCIVKVIIEKSRGEGSLIGQDTIENVSEPNFFF